MSSLIQYVIHILTFHCCGGKPEYIPPLMIIYMTLIHVNTKALIKKKKKILKIFHILKISVVQLLHTLQFSGWLKKIFLPTLYFGILLKFDLDLFHQCFCMPHAKCKGTVSSGHITYFFFNYFDVLSSTSDCPSEITNCTL